MSPMQTSRFVVACLKLLSCVNAIVLKIWASDWSAGEIVGLPNTFGEYDEMPEYTGQMLQVVVDIDSFTYTQTHALFFQGLIT